MKRERTRRARIRRHNAWGVILVVLSVVFLGALVAAWLMSRDRLRADGCPQSGPASVTVALVDATDALSSVQRVALENELTKIIDSLAVGGALQFWRVAPTAGDIPSPLAGAICNPGKTVSAWIGNPVKVAERHKKLFYEPSIGQVRELAKGTPERESPIMETIQAIALRTLSAPASSSAHAKRLIIASDLLQNSPTLSQLKGVSSFDAFHESDGFKRVAAPLQGVEVKVFYLRREHSPQGKQHIAFWQAFLAANGAALKELISIAGIG
jgi:hypothetical protein